MALHALPDRVLKDIGVFRSEIDRLADDLVNGRHDHTRRVRR